MTIKTPLEQYHELFAPYFAEYAALPENSYDIDASTDVTEMLRAAQDHGLEVCGYPEAKSRRMVLSAGRTHVGFAAAQPSLMRPALMAFCADKLIQKAFYARSGIAHAAGFEVTSREDAVARWRALGRSVVLKPVQGRQGIGVSVGVSGDADVARAFDYARSERAGSRVLMEQTCIGSDLRVIVLGRKVVCCYLKLPPNVTGDGTSRIADLVTAKNAQRALSPALRVAMIKTDALAEDVLAQQKLTWDSVPELGQSVILRLTQSVSSGGDLLPLTERLSAQIRHMSEALAEGLDYDGPLGLDVLTDQIETDGAQAVICETNPQPALFGALYPPKGASFDGPAHIIREVFGPAPKPKARPRDWTIETHGTQADELENACAALPSNPGVQLVVQQGGLIHARGTKTQMNSVMAHLLDPARPPRFVDRAVLRPADPRKHAWPAAKSKKLLEITPPRRDTPLRQSDCLSLLAPRDGLQVSSTGAEGYTAHDEAQCHYVSAQLNAWLTTALASDGGHMALRHRLACAGFPLSPKLVVKRDDIKTARRYVARQAQPCLLELWSRGDQIICGPVKNAKALDRKLSRYGSKKTKQIVLIPQAPEQVLDVLVFRGVTYGAAQDKPATRVTDVHFDWSRLAEQVVAVLPGALCVCVRFVLQDPENSSAHQNWSVETIDADPDLARFGFEASSAATSLSKRIVKEQLAQAI